jgi:hypothetical protein
MLLNQAKLQAQGDQRTNGLLKYLKKKEAVDKNKMRRGFTHVEQFV